MPAHKHNSADHHKADCGVGRRCGKNQRAEQGDGNHYAEHEPVQCRCLNIIQHRQLVFATRRQRGEENVKTQQRQATGEPAAKKFSKNQLRPAQGFRQQRQQCAIFTFCRDLPGGGGDGDDERRKPDEQQADFLEVTDDLVVNENVDRGHDQAEHNGHDEQDVKVLATIQFFDDDAGDGKNILHGLSWA
jgi:hypothetical protein